MKGFYLMPKKLVISEKEICKPRRHMYKSEKVLPNSKAKELLTKYRKGLIWKDL